MSSYDSNKQNSNTTQPIVSYMCDPYCRENAECNIIVRMPNNTLASLPIQVMFVRFDEFTMQSYIYVIGSYTLNYSSPIYITAKMPSDKGTYGVIASIVGG